MSIKTHLFHRIHCDICDEPINDEALFWHDVGQAIDDWDCSDQEFNIEGHQYVCENCWTWADDDETKIIKRSPND